MVFWFFGSPCVAQDSVASSIIKEMDADGDGSITFDEFEDWWKKMKTEQYQQMNEETSAGFGGQPASPAPGQRRSSPSNGCGCRDLTEKIVALSKQMSTLQTTVDKLVVSLPDKG